MNNRLQQFIAAENISQAQLADSLNVARASISHILAGRNKPSYDFISSLMTEFPNLNMEWLMFGKGKMYKEQTENRQSFLFPEEDPEEAFSDVTKASDGNIVSSNEMVSLDSITKIVEKQRNIKKIIVLFDDGSFQEI